MKEHEQEYRASLEKLVRDYEYEVSWRQKRIGELRIALQDHVHEPQSNYAWLDTCKICGIVTEGEGL